MAKYIQRGNCINYTNTTDAKIAYGDVVVLTERIGIAAADIPAGETGVLELSGVYEMAAETTTEFTVGQALYWDTANKRVTATKADTGAIAVGIAVDPKTTAGTAALVRL